MNATFSWKTGEMPKKGTVVWVRHDNQSLHWSYLPDGVSQPDIEKAFAESYDFGDRREPVACKATIMKGGKKTDQWPFTIQPPVKNF